MTMPKKAMVLAAGLGLRLRPITDTLPKPLVEVGGTTLLGHGLDQLAAAGVATAVVNTHYLGRQIEDHLQSRTDPAIVISSEADELLETGGGVAKALDNFGDDPFYVLNADILCLDGPTPSLARLAAAWNDDEMDGLLLLHSTVEAYGYRGDGDFEVDPLGKLERRAERGISPYLFTGIQMLHPRLFKAAPGGAFSINLLYDQAMESDRLYGIVHDGEWFHIGTPEGLAEANTYISQRFAGMRHR